MYKNYMISILVCRRPIREWVADSPNTFDMNKLREKINNIFTKLIFSLICLVIKFDLVCMGGCSAQMASTLHL